MQRKNTRFPSNLFAWRSNDFNVRGINYLSKNKLFEALADFNVALDMDANNISAYKNLRSILNSNTVNFTPIAKTVLFMLIQKLSPGHQVLLLEKCLQIGNPLGNRMAQEEKGCRPAKDTLKEIKDYLDLVNPEYDQKDKLTM